MCQSTQYRWWWLSRQSILTCKMDNNHSQACTVYSNIYDRIHIFRQFFWSRTLPYEQGDLDTDHPSTGTLLWECVCGIWMDLVYWHQLAELLFSTHWRTTHCWWVCRSNKIDWLSFCPLSEIFKVFENGKVFFCMRACLRMHSLWMCNFL